jgi:hypothetical protein
MLIKQIKLENFIVFKNAAVEFAPGLTVVLSPNEGGKSSLFRGIVAGLYTDAATRKSEVMALARWGSGGLFRIELCLELGGIGFRLVRDFSLKEQAIFREGEDRPLAKGKGVDAFLMDRLPLADESLFLRICGVRHEELGAVGDGSSEIGAKLEEILGGGWGNVTPADVKRVVETKRQELLRGTNRPAHDENWGPVKRHAEIAARAERELARAEETMRRREQLRTAVSKARGGIERMEAELEVLRSRRQKGARYAELEALEKSARARAEELRKQMDRLRELLTREAMLLEEAQRFPAALRDGDGASLSGIKRDLENELILRREIGGAEPESPRLGPRAGFAVAGMLILAGIAGMLLVNRYMLVLLAAGVALLGWCARGASAGAARIAASKRVELASLEERRMRWSGGRSAVDSKTLLDRFLALSGELKEVRARLEEISGDHRRISEDSLARLDAEYGSAALGARALAEERSALEMFRIDPSGLLGLDREIRLKENDIATAAAATEAQERELAGLGAGNVNEALERLEGEREKLRHAERKAEILGILLEILAEARMEVSNRLTERLPPLAGAYCARITRGRYGTLFIDPVRMEIETSPAEGDADTSGDAPRAIARICPDALSQGARDQLYFAVRLALVELMSRGEPQPLLLDDPFVHFDPERRARAIDLVREFAQKHQVILFTCDPRYREIDAPIIDLPARA